MAGAPKSHKHVVKRPRLSPGCPRHRAFDVHLWTSSTARPTLTRSYGTHFAEEPACLKAQPV